MLLISGQRVKSLHPAEKLRQSVCCQCIVCSERPMELGWVFFSGDFETLRSCQRADGRTCQPGDYGSRSERWPDTGVVGGLPAVTPSACKMGAMMLLKSSSQFAAVTLNDKVTPFFWHIHPVIYCKCS